MVETSGVIRCGRLAVVTQAHDAVRRLLRRGFLLEYATLGWNVIAIVVIRVRR